MPNLDQRLSMLERQQPEEGGVTSFILVPLQREGQENPAITSLVTGGQRWVRDAAETEGDLIARATREARRSGELVPMFASNL